MSCVECGTYENMTKHHINGGGKGPSNHLCRDCHDKKHGIKRHENIVHFEKRIRRAERRIRRDSKIIVETERQIAMLKAEQLILEATKK